MEGKQHQRSVQRSGPAPGQAGTCGMQQQHAKNPFLATTCNYNHHHYHRQIWTSEGAVGVPDAAMNATWVCPCASCIDCCIRHFNGALQPAGSGLVGGGGGGGCSCMLLLHLVQTCLVLVLFSFHQLVQILHLHSWWSSPAATNAGGVSKFPSTH